MDAPSLRFGSGKAVARVEDDALLQGRGVYTDDVALAGAGRLVFLRSPYAHAKIARIDATAARAMPGVRLVVTRDDIAAVPPIGGLADMKRPDGSPGTSAPRHILATDAVRYVGEAVAAVVADTLDIARDAAEAIEVDYDELPAVVTIDDALAPSAPRLGPQADNIAAQAQYGDAAKVDAAIAAARHVVKLHLVNQRLAPLSIEPRSVAAYIENERLTVRLSSQMPSGVRDVVSGSLGLEPAKVRVLVGDVGGGFGMKTSAYPEDVVVAWCAQRLKQPVRWTADRSEEFLSSGHGRDIVTDATLALDANGRVSALRIHSNANIGAYGTVIGAIIQLLIGPWVQTSVYDIQNVDFRFTAVLTNTACTGAYRGAGRPEAIYNIERLMDEAARATGIDRTELRRRNFIRPEQMPYTNPMQQTYDVGSFETIMDQGLSRADWKGFAVREQAALSRGRWRGIGIATFLEWTGANAFEETVNLRVTSDDQGEAIIEVYSAVMGMGQGIVTSLAQLVVDIFDVPIERVRIVTGDTDRGNGAGSAGSRSIFTGGSAVSVGSKQTLDKARELAAKDMEVAERDLEYRAGTFHVAGTDLKRTLGQVAAKQPQGRIEVDSSTTAKGPTWPNACHIAEVEIDPDTGHVQVVAYASVNDVGRVVNPTIVRGQLDGGAIQGIGQALTEAMTYDRESGQLLTGTLMDYAAPRAEIAAAFFDTTMDERFPSVNNVLGVKGVGELGTIGATPAVINAVADALARRGRAELTTKLQMPVTAARLWGLLNG
jgi:aerobic carbon-monoxide dehydrogenase large subunit